MLELHVYGPAFGLPSIDAHCLAAIALVRTCLSDGDWVLVACNTPVANHLPAIKDQDLWVTGWHNIVAYLAEVYHDIDAGLDDEQTATRDAYTAMIESRGLPLLDLSLYISSDNYTTCTRGALSHILTWPQSWTVPQQLREQARRRSDHLGLGALDVDAVREKELQKNDHGVSAQIPKSLRTNAQSVTSLLGSNAQQARFRLEAVTADFFEPLQHYVENLRTDSITTADCVAIGVTAQMLITDLPQPWLADLLSQKYPKLHSWVLAQTTAMFGGPPSAEAKAFQSSLLPWRPSPTLSWTESAVSILDTLLLSLPGVDGRSEIVRSTAQQGSTVRRLQSQQRIRQTQQHRQRTIQAIVGGCVSCAGLLGVLIYTGRLRLLSRRPPPIRRSFGEAGVLLGLR